MLIKDGSKFKRSFSFLLDLTSEHGRDWSLSKVFGLTNQSFDESLRLKLTSFDRQGLPSHWVLS